MIALLFASQASQETQRAPQELPEHPKTTPRTPHEFPRAPQEHPKSIPRNSKNTPGCYPASLQACKPSTLRPEPPSLQVSKPPSLQAYKPPITKWGAGGRGGAFRSGRSPSGRAVSRLTWSKVQVQVWKSVPSGIIKSLMGPASGAGPWGIYSLGRPLGDQNSVPVLVGDLPATARILSTTNA